MCLTELQQNVFANKFTSILPFASILNIDPGIPDNAISNSWYIFTCLWKQLQWWLYIYLLHTGKKLKTIKTASNHFA